MLYTPFLAYAAKETSRKIQIKTYYTDIRAQHHPTFHDGLSFKYPTNITPFCVYLTAFIACIYYQKLQLNAEEKSNIADSKERFKMRLLAIASVCLPIFILNSL